MNPFKIIKDYCVNKYKAGVAFDDQKFSGRIARAMQRKGAAKWISRMTGGFVGTLAGTIAASVAGACLITAFIVPSIPMIVAGIAGAASLPFLIGLTVDARYNYNQSYPFEKEDKKEAPAAQTGSTLKDVAAKPDFKNSAGVTPSVDKPKDTPANDAANKRDAAGNNSGAPKNNS